MYCCKPTLEFQISVLLTINYEYSTVPDTSNVVDWPRASLREVCWDVDFSISTKTSKMINI